MLGFIIEVSRMAKVLFIIAKKNFRDEELFHPKEEIENAGHETVIASTEKGICFGSVEKTAEAEISLNEVNANEFDAIIFVGGAGSNVFFENKNAIELSKQFFSQKKVVAAICIAPVTLANAGLLNGKKATAYPSCEKNLKEKGAHYTGKPVEENELIITANGPAAAREFGKKICKLLKKQKNKPL
jgi:protease I